MVNRLFTVIFPLAVCFMLSGSGMTSVFDNPSNKSIPEEKNPGIKPTPDFLMEESQERGKTIHRVWHPLKVDFKGPAHKAADTDPNPFLDYRLQVLFTSPSGKKYNVPGYFDGDGKGGSEGSVWRANFTPDEQGEWFYNAEMVKGSGIAVHIGLTSGEKVILKSAEGNLYIAPADQEEDGFPGLGRVIADGISFYYKTAGNNQIWIKGGTDSPENFLAYEGFVNTTPNPEHPEWFHDYASHISDWQPGDPDWGNGKGKGIIGALNYLSARKVNSLYLLLCNIGGDGQDVWPFLGPIRRSGDRRNNILHFDIPKLHQWELVFSHAQQKGILLHFVLGEGEEANKKEMDDGSLGVERKLYYREMIARFAHHNGIQWNISEEYDIPPYPLEPWKIREFARFIRSTDPYSHPVTVHNWHPDGFVPFIGNPLFTAISNQYYPFHQHKNSKTGLPIIRGYGDLAEFWRGKSKESGNILPLCFDETNQSSVIDDCSFMPDGFPFLSGQSFLRREVIWPGFLSGAAGIEFISGEVLGLNDFHKNEKLWDYLYYARSFLENQLPVADMVPGDHLLASECSGTFEDGQVFMKKGEVYVLYLPDARGTGFLNLPEPADHKRYSLRWYNPRKGSFEGPPCTIGGGREISPGVPPSEAGEDWVVLIQRMQ